MIPLTLITGFLGSGKTTLLKHVIERNRTRKIACLVNEFSSLDVDGQILADTAANVMSIPGGSIFCQCLVTQFIGTLKMVAEKFDQPDAPLEGVVVEASGIADPRAVRQMLEETKLDQVYQLGRIVSVVDPGSFEKLLKTLPNISAQIEACDVALINKIDLYDHSTIQRTERGIKRINTQADIVRTQFACVNLDLFNACDHAALQGQYAPCADPNYLTFRATIDEPVRLDLLLDRLNELRDSVYRIKGFVSVGDACVYIDASEGGVSAMPADENPARKELIFIIPPEGEAMVAPLVRSLEQGML
jgi:G3E family GTPase